MAQPTRAGQMRSRWDSIRNPDHDPGWVNRRLPRNFPTRSMPVSCTVQVPDISRNTTGMLANKFVEFYDRKEVTASTPG